MTSRMLRAYVLLTTCAIVTCANGSENVSDGGGASGDGDASKDTSQAGSNDEPGSDEGDASQAAGGAGVTPGETSTGGGSAAETAKNPFNGDADAAARGKTHYEAQFCGACHGADGTGVGELPSLAASAKEWSDEQLRSVIADGAGTMPGYSEKLDDDQVWEVVTYVRTFASGG